MSVGTGIIFCGLAEYELVKTLEAGFMSICRKAVLLSLSAVMLISFAFSAFADGSDPDFEAYQAYSSTNGEILNGISAESAVVIETESRTVLAELNPDSVQSISHLAKLMTVLIAADKIDRGELSLEDTVITSAHANSMGGTQIWLNVGEEITVARRFKALP